ncbi:TPA: autotransporter outer membrane beta-barrel domain-containing protein [Stenotrophomonas maltophilia]|nr:autotransporter outer membrane beta-barrel domain-containing protein [Stenotrophomonas maltophilia]
MNASPTRPRRASARACATRVPLIPGLLASALCAALPAHAAELTGPLQVSGGDSLQLGADDVLSHSASGFALTVSGAGSHAQIAGSHIKVTGNGSAVSATQGGQVQLQGATLSIAPATGVGFYALYASGAGSVIDAHDVDIDGTHNGSGYASVQAYNGGVLRYRGGRITVSGGVGTLAGASGNGSEVHLDNLQMSAGSGARLRAESAGLLTIRNSRITLAPGGVLAGVAVDGAGSRAELYDTRIDGGWFDIGGGGSVLLENVQADSVGGSLRLLGSSIARVHSSAVINGGRFDTVGGYGVNVNSWGQLTADGTHFTVRDGNSGIWLSGADSLADLSNTVISTFGDTGYGHGVDVWGGTATITGGSIDTHGDGVYGLRASGSSPPTPYSRIRARNVDIATYGAASGGVFLGGSTADVQLDGGSISTYGASSFGIVQMNTARLTADNLRIHAQGANSGAYRSYITVFGPYWDRVVFNNSQIETNSGAAFWLQGSNHALSVNGSDVIAGDGSGRLLRVSDTVFTDGSRVATSRIDFSADASTLRGDVVVDSATAEVHMVLRNNTRFIGALRDESGFRVARLALDGSSQWNVRASSSVGTLEHAGSIVFDAPASGEFKTITVDGDYVGQGGHWVFNRALGDDASLGDQLVIGGNSSGTASVSVRNAGGAGALTREGIRLISVGGQSDAQFSLQGRAVAGAYDYFLFKGGTSTPDDGHWYLRSEYVPPVDPPVPPVDPPVDPPAPPIDPPGPPQPPVDPPLPPAPPIDPPRPQVERPEPAAYLANRSAALGMFRHSLHDRAGDPATENGSDAVAWMHLRSEQPGSHNRSRQVRVEGHINSLLIGAGRRFDVGGSGELQAGAMLGHGRARNDSRSQLTGYAARGVITGSSVGAYATWLQDARLEGGAYLDGWLQYGRFRNSVQGDGLHKERYDARSWSASAEAGYVLPLQRTAQRGIYLEPQVQVVHSRYDSDRVVEANGTRVEDRGGGETGTRLGLRLYSRALGAAQDQVHPYVAVNWWSGGNGAGLAMDGERLQRQLPRDVYEAKAGVQLNLSGGWRGWGEISRQRGGMGFRNVGAQLGLSYNW